jgi:protein-disulfide isomerase
MSQYVPPFDVPPPPPPPPGPPDPSGASEKKGNIWIWVSGALALALVVVVVVFSMIVFKPSISGQPVSDYQVSVAKDSNVVSVVKNGVTPSVSVDVYFDYMCPYCGQFERANQLDLGDLLAEGKITVNFHVMSFLDEASNGTKFSTRAGNAALTVASKAPAAFMDFNEAMFANQPAEGTPGLSDQDIADLAARAGVPEAVISALPAGDFNNAIAQSTQQDFQVVTGTPTVLLNGTKFEGGIYTKGQLKAAIVAMI